MEKGPSGWGDRWTSEESAQAHYDKHGDEMGFDKFDEYTSAATNFANGKGRGIKSFKGKDGSTYIYNPKTGEFIIVSNNGAIITYFNANNGYFYGQYEEYGDYFIN